jgi:hypothetical protein
MAWGGTVGHSRVGGSAAELAADELPDRTWYEPRRPGHGYRVAADNDWRAPLPLQPDVPTDVGTVLPGTPHAASAVRLDGS